MCQKPDPGGPLYLTTHHEDRRGVERVDQPHGGAFGKEQPAAQCAPFAGGAGGVEVLADGAFNLKVGAVYWAVSCLVIRRSCAIRASLRKGQKTGAALGMTKTKA